MNAPLTAPQQARALAAEFAGRAAQHDRDASFPFENFAQLHEAGLLGLATPRELGGAGASLAELAGVVGAIGQACPATALVLNMQYMQHRSLGRGSGWPQALAQRIATEAIEKGALINALRVEPELGSPARGGLPATIVRRTRQGLRLDGHKQYSTGAPILGWYAVWARTDDEAPRVGMFLVQAGLTGTRIVPTWDHLGLRASGSHDIVFDDVALPDDAAIDVRLPHEWSRGADAAMQADMAATLSSLYDGVARAARDWLVHFLRTRAPASLGAPLATLPRAQEAVGAIEALLLTNARLIDSLVREADAGTPPSAVDSGLIKQVVTSHSIRVVESALELTSNHGLSRHNPLERHLRDVLCARVHTPQDDSARIAAGLRALKA